MANKGAKKQATKGQILTGISEQTSLNKKQVASVFDALAGMIKSNLGSRGPGIFTVPGLLKLTVQMKPATKARKGINPFTKEEIMIKAKPARKAVKIRALKNLKEMVK
jgi:nucleoid DNA-binding protein